MATKKQKRQEALARRAEFFEEVKRTGLEAQRKDRERRIKEAARELRQKKKVAAGG